MKRIKYKRDPFETAKRCIEIALSYSMSTTPSSNKIQINCDVSNSKRGFALSLLMDIVRRYGATLQLEKYLKQCIKDFPVKGKLLDAAKKVLAYISIRNVAKP